MFTPARNCLPTASAAGAHIALKVSAVIARIVRARIRPLQQFHQNRRAKRDIVLAGIGCGMLIEECSGYSWSQRDGKAAEA
jgi:hypothetical protein